MGVELGWADGKQDWAASHDAVLTVGEAETIVSSAVKRQPEHEGVGEAPPKQSTQVPVILAFAQDPSNPRHVTIPALMVASEHALAPPQSTKSAVMVAALQATNPSHVTSAEPVMVLVSQAFVPSH